jgi:hypothetical protein
MPAPSRARARRDNQARARAQQADRPRREEDPIKTQRIPNFARDGKDEIGVNREADI